MKAIVLFASVHGNTEKIAQAICSGMKQSGYDVDCKSVHSINAEELKAYDIWILGSPTRWGGASRKLRSLAKNASADGRKRTAATFDTRMKNVAKGGAEKLEGILAAKGIEVKKAVHFTVVGMRGPLADGEETRAMNFGRDILNEIAP